MGEPNFKIIHIGSIIKEKVKEQKIDSERICNFINVKDKDILSMYSMRSLDSEIILKWCKLLRYDLFRLYSQHLIIYCPTKLSNSSDLLEEKKESQLPQFKKNIYTKELIDFILEQINSKKMTKKQVIDDYRIPKTTLYKWIQKYKKNI